MFQNTITDLCPSPLNLGNHFGMDVQQIAVIVEMSRAPKLAKVVLGAQEIMTRIHLLQGFWPVGGKNRLIICFCNVYHKPLMFHL